MKKHDANRYSAWWALALVLCCLCACAAIPAGSQWEIRAACMTSAQYGGFYSPEDAAGGGLDYSQQDNPQLTLTDIVCENATSTTLTSATGGFTLAMKGNGLYLSGGTNLTAGWYCITGYTDTNTVTVDRAANSGGLNGTGGTVRVGGACGFVDAVFEAATAGNTYYVKADGTHSLSAAVTIANAASAALHVKIVGYGSTHSDRPTGDNRPLISSQSYGITLGTYWDLSDIRRSTSLSASGIIGGEGSTISRVKSVHTGTAGYYCIYLLQAKSLMIDCEASKAQSSGIALGMGGTSGTAIGCYAYDSPTGFSAGAGRNIISCIADNCTYGISLAAASDGVAVVGCTIYGGTDGINIAAGGDPIWIVNTIISSCTTGISSGDANTNGVFEDYNNIYDCTTDRTNVPVGPNSYDLDPGFVDAANGDFRVGPNCKAKGFPGAIPGAAATCIGYLDTGAVQRIEPTGGGGTRVTGGVW